MNARKIACAIAWLTAALLPGLIAFLALTFADADSEPSVHAAAPASPRAKRASASPQPSARVLPVGRGDALSLSCERP